MNTVTIWDKRSPDFGANRFVDEHGTSTIQIESERDALLLMGKAIHTPDIDEAVLHGPRGSLVWKQCPLDEDEFDDSYCENDYPDISRGDEDDVDTSDPRM